MDAGSETPEAESEVGNDGDHRNLNKARAANVVRGRFTGNGESPGRRQVLVRKKWRGCEEVYTAYGILYAMWRWRRDRKYVIDSKTELERSRSLIRKSP